ncbi:MAG: hypothetical protein ABIF09_09445, partial [Gemmatimonadota bacterium]
LADMAPVLSEASQSIAELFTTDVPLEFVLAADFDALGKDRSQETEDRPAQILIRGLDGGPVEIPMQVKTRGIFRLQRRICPDPPLRLNLPETSPQGTVLDGQDKLKLVTHCRDSDRYEQNLLEEYLAYRIYNRLTDLSLRVQLAKVTYIDTSGKADPVTRMAFLLEEEDAMADRLGGRMIEPPSANPSDFVQDQLGMMYLFQFMVGNVDWGTGTSHNVVILQKDFEYFPIPYDFDWTGLVDAPYAGPNPMTEPFHESVRERLYWGACLPGIDYEELFGRFRREQDAILSLARNQLGLSKQNVESAVGYLEEFFTIINDPGKAERAIIKACRQW